MAYYRSLYEITISKDGETYLVCYASGTPSGAILRKIIRKRWDYLQAFTGKAEMSWQVTTKTLGARAQYEFEDWTIRYSGRTQLDQANTWLMLTEISSGLRLMAWYTGGSDSGRLIH